MSDSCNWIQRQFDATRFTASGSMAWTVEAGDVVTDAYIVNGKTVTYSLVLSSSTLSGTASNEVRVTLPSKLVVMRTMSNVVRLFDTTNNAYVGYAYVTPGVDYIRISRLDFGPFTLVTNGFGIHAQITFEIE